MELAAARRLYELRHKERPYHDGTFKFWAEEPSRNFPYKYDDGVTIWLSPSELNPEDEFLGVPPSLQRGNSERNRAE
jgi:hypothetical protein